MALMNRRNLPQTNQKNPLKLRNKRRSLVWKHFTAITDGIVHCYLIRWRHSFVHKIGFVLHQTPINLQDDMDEVE
ncbi:hypothetical protein LguiB_030585 [Lonicera macranthoides]